jgi:hypothetical protein
VKLRTFIGHTKGIQINDLDVPKEAELTVLLDEDIVVLAHDPQDANRMLAGSYGRGLFRSLDGGVNWSRVELDVEYVRTVVFPDC